MKYTGYKVLTPLVNILTSNCIYKDGNIKVELKSVFGMVLKSAENKSWCTLSDYLRNFIDDMNLVFSVKQLLMESL